MGLLQGQLHPADAGSKVEAQVLLRDLHQAPVLNDRLLAGEAQVGPQGGHQVVAPEPGLSAASGVVVAGGLGQRGGEGEAPAGGTVTEASK